MRLIYLASPYSHKEKLIQEHRYKLITHVAARLTHQHGYAMFLPITQSHQLVEALPTQLSGTFQKWQDIDLYMVEKADELWVCTMPGWRESVGVTAEIEHAKTLGKPIYYIDDVTLTKTSKPIA